MLQSYGNQETCFSHRDTLTDQWYRTEDPRNTFAGIWTCAQQIHVEKTSFSINAARAIGYL